MNASDFLRLPPGVKILVVVMLWPAIWAGAAFVVAFIGDVRRLRQRRSALRARRSGDVEQYAR